MSGRSSAAESIPAYLQELTAVAVAYIRADGVLTEANRGFWSLVGRSENAATPPTATDLHLHPPLHNLSAEPDTPEGTLLYQGTLRFPGPNGSVAMPGWIYRWRDGWLLAGEPGLEALERLRLSARRLQHELVETRQQLRVEVERRDGPAPALASRLDQMLQKELAALEQMVQASPSKVTAQLYGVGLLRDNVPESFRQMVRRYGEILELALEQQAYRVAHDLPEALRSLAERVGFLGGGPRDIVEIHTTALKEKCLKALPSRRQAYVEESRLLVLEFMGHLVAFYRQYAVLTNRPPPARGGPPEEGAS